MKKLAIAAVALSSLALAGCNLPTLNLQSSVDLNTEAGILSGYGLVVNAENALRANVDQGVVPLCKTGTLPSVSNICVKRSVMVQLQNADAKMNTTVNQMVAFTKAHPTVSPLQYISAAQDALLAVQAVLNSAKPAGV